MNYPDMQCLLTVDPILALDMLTEKIAADILNGT